jgi:hypothetical protein
MAATSKVRRASLRARAARTLTPVKADAPGDDKQRFGKSKKRKLKASEAKSLATAKATTPAKAALKKSKSGAKIASKCEITAPVENSAPAKRAAPPKPPAKPKPSTLVERVYRTIDGELGKLEKQKGLTSQDRERVSRALSQMVNALEKAVEMQREITKTKSAGGDARSKEALAHAEDLRREIADRPKI